MILVNGNGTETDPYQISNLEELKWITENPSSWGSHFILTADIYAASSSSWDNDANGIPDGFGNIGNQTTPFTGNFDGAGFTIQGLSEGQLFGTRTAESEVNILSLAYATLNSGGGLFFTMPQQATFLGDVISLPITASASGVYGIDGSLNIVDDTVLSLTNAAYSDYFASDQRIGVGSSFSGSLWTGALSLKRPASAKSGSGNFATVEFTALAEGTTRVDLSSLFSDRDGRVQINHSFPYYFTVMELWRFIGQVTYQSRSLHNGIEISLNGNSIAFTDSIGDFSVVDARLAAGNHILRADGEGFLPAEKTLDSQFAKRFRCWCY